MSQRSLSDNLSDAPPPAFIAASAVYRLILYGAIITLLHFIASSALHSNSWEVQILGIIPITVFLYHYMIPLEGVVQFVGVPVIGQLRWPNEAWAKIVRNFAILFVSNAILIVALMTEVFSTWTAFWHNRGIIDGSHSIADGFAAAERFYLWNLFDAIPSLNVTDSLHWRIGLTYTDSRSGALLLAYKVMVILPIVYGFIALFRQAWERSTRSYKATGPKS
jgi:hypothetical protein